VLAEATLSWGKTRTAGDDDLYRRPKAATHKSDRGTLEALWKSQVIIEFNIDGIVLTADANFLSLMGYELADVIGQHHYICALSVRQRPSIRNSGIGCAGPV